MADLQIEYHVDNERYVYRSLDALFPVASGDRPDVVTICDSFSAKEQVRLWFDPHRPHKAVLQKAGGLWILIPPALGLFLVSPAYFYASPAALSGMVAFGIAAFLFGSFLVDTVNNGLSVIHFAHQEIAQCPDPNSVAVDHAFIAKSEQEFIRRGFEKMCYLHAPRLIQVKHINLQSILVSPDRQTMAVVGQVRHIHSRVAGMFNMQGVYLHSMMSDGTILETLCGGTDRETSGKIQQRLPAETPMSEMISAHNEFAEKYAAKSDATTEGFHSPDDAIGHLKNGAGVRALVVFVVDPLPLQAGSILFQQRPTKSRRLSARN